MTQIIVTIFAFIFGASLGSFANVMADRLRVRSFWGGRSECLTCSKKLSWKELFPIFSFLYQKGRCKFCKTKLSQAYLWSEVVSGILVAILANTIVNYTFLFNAQLLMFLLWSLIITISVAIVIYDLKHTIVPFEMASILIFLGLIFTAYRQICFGFVWADALSGLIVALPFGLMYLVSRGKWVGFGDVMLYMAFGFLLGLPMGVTTFFYSIWLGAFVSVVLMVVHKKDYNLKSEIPFTPFIIIAALFVLYTNSDILSLYEFIR
jgi:prepilin signal peptidase PulO-like enzyme (type II secretory pathway)